MSDTAALPSISASGRASGRRRLYIAGAAILIVAYLVAALLHWDDRALLWFREAMTSPAAQAKAVWLPDYRVTIDARPLPGLENAEASDLTYDPVTRTLYSVMGKEPLLVQLSLQGDVLRRIPLVGWSNPEGISRLADGRLAIVDERQHTLTVVTVNPDTTALNFADFHSTDLGASPDGNKGYEGVAWDARHQRLLVGQERPSLLFSLKGNDSGFGSQKTPVASDALDMRNLSAMTFDPRTGHLLLLSADSHLLIEADENGQPVSFMTLLGHFNGLAHTVPRAEGVAMDDQGTLYVVSEPNLFYAFEKK
ncbi:SdiA-regulated domain-containing protein [Pseudomonas sp. DC3000-4b1]|uniref:SdiA-regulated domain-containing protein n=1 Tax=unclassified Pseudomonas TaxID=196821 RepID=UPI003CE75FE3